MKSTKASDEHNVVPAGRPTIPWYQIIEAIWIECQGSSANSRENGLNDAAIAAARITGRPASILLRYLKCAQASQLIEPMERRLRYQKFPFSIAEAISRVVRQDSDLARELIDEVAELDDRSSNVDKMLEQIREKSNRRPLMRRRSKFAEKFDTERFLNGWIPKNIQNLLGRGDAKIVPKFNRRDSIFWAPIVATCGKTGRDSRFEIHAFLVWAPPYVRPKNIIVRDLVLLSLVYDSLNIFVLEPDRREYEYTLQRVRDAGIRNIRFFILALKDRAPTENDIQSSRIDEYEVLSRDEIKMGADITNIDELRADFRQKAEERLNSSKDSPVLNHD